MKKKAVILFSGGLDSTTCLAIALNKGFDAYTLSFDYGQKHRAELDAASRLSLKMGATAHRVFPLAMAIFAGSALTDPALSIPDAQEGSDIPITYVPARNTVFLSIALAWAEALKAHDLFIGVSAVDYSHYPDCRPEYIAQFQKVANLATKESVEGTHCVIHAPLIHLSKADTIRQGIMLGVDYSQTVSCYRADATGIACGNCDSCRLRKKGFTEAGVSDPTRY